MSVESDHNLRTGRLRAALLLTADLRWNKDYILNDIGYQWKLQYMRPLTTEQYQRAEEALQAIMNS
jgi:hypothetical protein